MGSRGASTTSGLTQAARAQALPAAPPVAVTPPAATTFQEFDAIESQLFQDRDSVGHKTTELERDALANYTGAHYSAINSRLRKDEPLGAERTKWVKNLDKTIDKNRVKENIVVHRGMELLGNSPLLAQLKPGAVFKDKGYGSTTVSKANAFSGNVQLKIRVKAGSKAMSVAKYSSYKGEQEVLIGRNASYRVISATQKPGLYGSTRHLVTVELLDD